MSHMLGMHIVCDFQFDTYHNTFFRFSISINDTRVLRMRRVRLQLGKTLVKKDIVIAFSNVILWISH